MARLTKIAVSDFKKKPAVPAKAYKISDTINTGLRPCLSRSTPANKAPIAMKRAGMVKVKRTKKSALGTSANASAMLGRAGEIIMAASTVVVLPNKMVRFRKLVFENIFSPYCAYSYRSLSNCLKSN
jgi:hypothetical protein